MKPRIQWRMSVWGMPLWHCNGGGQTGIGLTPVDAYRHWSVVWRCYQDMIDAYRPRKWWEFWR